MEYLHCDVWKNGLILHLNRIESTSLYTFWKWSLLYNSFRLFMSELDDKSMYGGIAVLSLMLGS